MAGASHCREGHGAGEAGQCLPPIAALVEVRDQHDGGSALRCKIGQWSEKCPDSCISMCVGPSTKCGDGVDGDEPQIGDVVDGSSKRLDVFREVELALTAGLEQVYAIEVRASCFKSGADGVAGIVLGRAHENGSTRRVSLTGGPRAPNADLRSQVGGK
jgi:hypothetical protein